MDQRSDDELIVATAGGEAAAFAVFYRRHAEQLTMFLLRRVHNAEVAADLAAETFAAALAGCRRFRSDRGEAAAWLYGIAHHELAQLARRGAVDQRARRRLGMPRIELTDEQLERIEALAAAAPTGVVVARELAALPPEQRDAIHGRVVEEREYSEIAAQAAVSETVVRQRVSRGLATLRARLGREQS